MWGETLAYWIDIHKFMYIILVYVYYEMIDMHSFVRPYFMLNLTLKANRKNFPLGNVGIRIL